MAWIKDAKDIPLNQASGAVPKLTGALANWLQPMTFDVIGKAVANGEVYETITSTQSFRGVIIPGVKRLDFKPEGQRNWKWFTLYSDLGLTLDADDVVMYLGVQTRVVKVLPYDLYGYRMYELAQDFTGNGPT